ncbi:alpha/beta hydrolase [Sinorhizobium meliloti]|uniref:alpha/beta hydrolase n=1 Tax=Rhizobium meliloti TaxID=382 RepID=UPI003F14422B
MDDGSNHEMELAPLIDTGCIVARYQPANDTDLLVISFHPITRGKALWGASFFQKNGISVLGLTDYKKAWYPKAHMHRLLPVIAPIVARYRRVITYGHSMGGYAAMRYGRVLGADVGIVFSPQHSIDPLDVRHFDKGRADLHFRPALHMGMKIAEEDLPRQTLVFVDWRFRIDRRHAARLPQVDSLKFVLCPFSRHETIVMLTQARATTALFDLIREGDTDWRTMRSLVRQARRYSSVYQKFRGEYIDKRFPNGLPRYDPRSRQHRRLDQIVRAGAAFAAIASVVTGAFAALSLMLL